MPSKKYQKLLHAAGLEETDLRGVNGRLIIDATLKRRLFTGNLRTFEGVTYSAPPTETQPWLRGSPKKELVVT